MYFQLESPTMTSADNLQDFMQQDSGPLLEFDLMSDVRNIAGDFADQIESFPEYETLAQDKEANNETISISRPGEMPGVFALFGFPAP